MAGHNSDSQKVGTDVVMVRAFADEPVRLLAVGVSGRHVSVVGNTLDRSVGFPLEAVYVYEDTRFEALREAFASSDRETLLSLWSEAEFYA